MNGMSSCKRKKPPRILQNVSNPDNERVCVDWDEAIGNITDTLKRVGMWEKTLWVMSGE